jgi:hypothetical protein
VVAHAIPAETVNMTLCSRGWESVDVACPRS